MGFCGFANMSYVFPLLFFIMYYICDPSNQTEAKIKFDLNDLMLSF